MQPSEGAVISHNRGEFTVLSQRSCCYAGRGGTPPPCSPFDDHGCGSGYSQFLVNVARKRPSRYDGRRSARFAVSDLEFWRSDC
eukprot:gene10123-biopygen9549